MLLWSNFNHRMRTFQNCRQSERKSIACNKVLKQTYLQKCKRSNIYFWNWNCMLAARLKGIPPKDCFLSFDKLQTLWNVFTVLCAMYVFCCKISSSVSKSLYGVRMEPIFYQFLEGSLRAFILWKRRTKFKYPPKTTGVNRFSVRKLKYNWIIS